MADITAQVTQVREDFANQQQRIWSALTKELDPSVRKPDIQFETVTGPLSRPLVCTHGSLIEKAACNFTHSQGSALPEAASARNPHLAGKSFSASALSVIVHPRHPHIPTVHMNVRFFAVGDGANHWHFGGGLDLTPHLLYQEDARLWHESAKNCCMSEDQYHQFKEHCDQYFYLPHRQEARGIGGLFFDDLNLPDFESCLVLCQNICTAFRESYGTIFERRQKSPWSAEDEYWMLHRRSRYVEFNLIYDRGTTYGLQSGRNVESVLASMPPRVEWVYARETRNEAQETLLECLKNPVDWTSSN